MLCFIASTLCFPCLLLSIFKMSDIWMEFSGTLQGSIIRFNAHCSVLMVWTWNSAHPYLCKQSHMLLQQSYLQSAHQHCACFDADINLCSLGWGILLSMCFPVHKYGGEMIVYFSCRATVCDHKEPHRLVQCHCKITSMGALSCCFNFMRYPGGGCISWRVNLCAKIIIYFTSSFVW